MIRYFREGLKPSIKAQLDIQGRELDSWEETIEKAVNIEAKGLLQTITRTQEINSRYFQGNRPKKKKEKNSKKAKSTDISSIDKY